MYRWDVPLVLDSHNLLDVAIAQSRTCGRARSQLHRYIEPTVRVSGLVGDTDYIRHKFI